MIETVDTGHPLAPKYAYCHTMPNFNNYNYPRLDIWSSILTILNARRNFEAQNLQESTFEKFSNF